MKTLQERFDEKYIPEPMSGCWLWEATLDQKGYGSMRVKNKPTRAHRLSWKLHNGDPGELCVLHRCDVRCCVNPDHLFVGTYDDNNKDRSRKGRTCREARPEIQGCRHHSSKLSEPDVIEILKSKEKIIILAAQFGVSGSVISEIRTRKAWKHLEVQ